jgi:alkylation response protein AidB-like acyl-CoA dehydrogenase
MALTVDRAVQADRRYLAEELVHLAARHRLLSMYLPRFMGGSFSGSVLGLFPVLEELAAVDPGFVGLIGGHHLGLTALALSFNFRLMDRVAGLVVRGEQTGRPFLIDCAITEPGAGSDVEEEDLFPRADLCTRARAVPGGAVLSGRKCFISTGHLADWHLVIIPYDRTHPLDKIGLFLVPKNSPGFSLGALEEKMGQKAAPASELVFDDCFVPSDMIVTQPGDLPPGRGEALLHGVLGITRTAVGAMGAGMARGAFEIALDFAAWHRVRGRRMIDRQGVQETLIRMLARVHQARAVYLEAAFALCSAFLPAQIPGFLNSALYARLYRTRFLTRLRHHAWFRRRAYRLFAGRPVTDHQRVQFYSSLAKVTGTDAGLANAHQALDLMGEAGSRHENGAEKLFRDAKLGQIYEGANELNRLHMFKHFLARDLGVDVFGTDPK